MPVTKPKAPPAATRYPPPLPTEPTVASKKKKKKKGKGKAQESSNLTLHSNHIDHDGLDDDDDDEDGPRAPENDVGRRNLDPEYDTPRYPTSQTSPLSSVQQDSLRMPTTATAHGKLLAAANELYKRMESEQRANDANEAEYWSSLPSHIRSFVETTYHQGVALNPQEMAKSQAMLDLAHAMVDEAQSRGSFPPPFDPSLLSDPKIAEKIVMKHGGLNAMMRDLADDTYDDYVSENDEEDMEDEQQYEPDESAKKKKKKKKKGANAAAVNGSNTQTVPPPIIPSVPSPMPSVTRAAPSVAQPRPSSRAAGKQPVYNQPTIPPARTTRSTATKSPAPSNSYSHGYTKSAATNGTASLTKRPTGGGSDKEKSKLWNNSTEQERERIKEFWLGLSETERKDLVKLEKEAVLKKMKEQQKHSCSCAVCGRKRNAIEEELEVLYDAYYEELEQYAIHQQQYQSSGGKITPPPGPGPFPGSVAVDKHGALIGGPPNLTKHPSRGRPMTNGIRGQPLPPESDGYDDDEDYDDEDDDYEDDDEEEEEEEDESTRKLGSRRRGLPPGPLTRRANGREDFFNFSSLTAAGPGNILTVADDLLKNDGGKFLEMMEQLAERRMQREEEAVREVEMDSEEEEEEEDPEGSEEEEDDDDNDDESDGEEDDPMSEEQKMEEGRKMFSIFAARMFEQRVLNAYREKVAAERQAQLLRELADEDKMQAEKDAKRAKENQKKKDKKKQQKMAKEAEKAKKDAEKAAEEAAQRAKSEAHEEEMRKKREDDRLKRETERKQKEEEKARLAEERRQRVAEQKAIEAERKREKEERERKERVARQEKEAQAKAEKAEREKKAKEERLAKEAKEKEERERRDKEEKERKEKERLEAQKADDRKKQEAQAAAAKTPQVPISPRSSSSTIGTNTSTKKSPATTKVNGVSPAQRPPVAPISRAPSLQQPSQPPMSSGQRPVLAQTQTPVSPSMQFSPNLSMQPLGMTPYNPMVSPTTSISPRMPFNPQSSVSAGPGPYSPIIPFAQPASQPSIANVMSNGMIGNAPYPFEMQPTLVPQAQQATSLPVQPVRPPSTLPPGLAIPSKVLATPTNGMPGIGITPLTPNAAAPHIRRASAQANPSPFGAIGKPLGARGPSSVIEDDDRIPSVGTSVSKPSPPSPDRPLGSSALVDENDDIVPIPKRRGGAPGWPENIGTAAPGSRWNRTSITSWPTPSTPGSVGAPWSAAPGRP